MRQILLTNFQRKKVGRKSYHQLCPEIITELKNLLNTHSGSAQDRRRDDAIRFNGLSIVDCNKHIKKRLMKKYSIINKISNSTVRRYFLPPKNNIQSSKYYKSRILAKIPQKRNSQSIKEHNDFHFTCAMVNYVEELSSLYSDEILALSCDNKSKIPLGAPAVSRYVRSRKFHLVENQPNLPDHDFPRRGIRINPSAYVVLSNIRKRSSSVDNHPSCELKTKKRSRSCDIQLFPDIKQRTIMTTDKRNLEHVIWSRTGHLFIRPFGSGTDQSIKATSEVHINNIQQITTENNMIFHKSVITIISDNGPDWSTDCMANIYNLGRFWEEQKLDALVWVSYAPGHSRFNPIERMFSRLTDLLQGVVIDLDPSFKETSQQLDMALIELSKYWNNKTYCNYKIDCRPMFSVNGNIFDGHEKLKNLLMTKSQIQIEQNPNVQFSLQLYLRHCVRSTYYMSFIKCDDKYCVHCPRYPIRATKTMSLLRAGGGYIPWPTMTYSNKHYDTFLQRTFSILSGEKNLNPDEHLLSRSKVKCSKCKLPYVFLSKADKDRHNQWIHAPTTKLKRSSIQGNKIVKRKRLSISHEY
ncbi:unnamed protein product [Rotaria sordida]|uniref:Uncharacterized protein n=2 Tax=Rotaria sordida TaxID=392033 RepID=A0A815QCV1_9BILA|nr:unnamed protein product [Rotaria sordida]CAF1462202.1 unnamed protein product [Rotaria sordida]CAF3880369.1 unnamed protein product [Rotaria sordida]